eukprot:gene63051-86256_t
MMADDSCYELLLEGVPSGVVEIPVDWVRDDAVYLLFNRTPPTRPVLSPDDVLGIFRRELDMAIDEAGVFQVDLHPFVIGYRSRIFILDELIRHAKARGPPETTRLPARERGLAGAATLPPGQEASALRRRFRHHPARRCGANPPALRANPPPCLTAGLDATGATTMQDQ